MKDSSKLYKTSSPKGDGNCIVTIYDEPIDFTKPLPRKGMETILVQSVGFRGLRGLYKTSSPKGDGNIGKSSSSVNRAVQLYKTSSPKGDGNFELVDAAQRPRGVLYLYKTSSPKGDGNHEQTQRHYQQRKLYKTSSPKGDGNLNTVGGVQIRVSVFTKPLPRKGMETLLPSPQSENL